MLETSARLLRLRSLLQTHRGWSGAEPADRLAVTERTVRRDVDRVRRLGYPVDAQPGSGGGYRLLTAWLADEDGVTVGEAGGGSRVVAGRVLLLVVCDVRVRTS